MKYFIFNCAVKAESYTVIFDSQRLVSEDDLTAQLKDFHRTNSRCANIFYIFPDRRQEMSELVNIVSSSANVSVEEVILAPYNEFGLITINDLTDAILLYGNLDIIKRHSAILQSDNNYHYVNPSGKHTPFFIRTGNILAKNEEINFIAFQILKYLEEDFLPEIACDTASIIAIPYAIAQLFDLFDKKFNIPIRSFGSYKNLKDYAFKKGSLVLLSASNSGNLEDEVLAIESDLVSVTIILNCKNIVSSQGRTRKYVTNIHDLFNTLISNTCSVDHYKAGSCKYCDENSIPVYVHGDQFIPSKIIVQEVLIRKHHKAPTLNKVIEDFAGSKSIMAYKSETVNEKIREIFIDIQKLLSTPGGFFKKYQSLLKNEIPSSISLIIALEDQSSIALANDVHKYLSIVLRKQLPGPVVQRDLSGLHELKDIENILVVAASISTGNLLNSISRTLRKFKNSSIHYLIAFARLNDSDKLKLLTNNLRSRQGTEEQNHVHVLYECPMPNHHTEHLASYQKGPWWQEGVFFQNKLDRHPEFNPLLEARLMELRTNRGMLDNLFLPNAFNGTALTLRPNFAFYDFDSNTPPSQADVYFIFLQVFHSLRNPNIIQRKERDDKFFMHHEHVKSVVSPENFTRFNDGIIQACLLRIASPIELDYSASEDISLLMLNKLKIILQKDDLESSEAILEFLLAIASKKMKLLEPHVRQLYDHIKEQFSGNAHIDMFLTLIKENEHL